MTTEELVIELLHRLENEKITSASRQYQIKELTHYLRNEHLYRQSLNNEIPETD